MTKEVKDEDFFYFNDFYSTQHSTMTQEPYIQYRTIFYQSVNTRSVS